MAFFVNLRPIHIFKTCNGLQKKFAYSNLANGKVLYVIVIHLPIV